MIKVATPVVGEEEEQALIEVLRSGNYVSGKKVQEFEKAWAEYVGTEHCVMLSSGTDALIYSLFGAEIRPGEEVIVPPHTFFATVAAVIHAGGRPVFADIDPNTYCLDPEDAKEKMTRRTRAIIPVHIYGTPADMDPFNELVYEEQEGRWRHHPFIIEDSAQAHGSEYKGRRAGSLGDMSCWSFYATKNLTTGEEGGAITTNNGYAAKRISVLRNHGMADRNTHGWIGSNSRMSEFGAAFGLAQLKKLDALNAKRNQNSHYLLKELGKLSIDWMKLPYIPDYCTAHSWFWFWIRIDEEKLGMPTLEFRKTLRELEIETRHRYLEPLYRQPALRPYSNHYAELRLPNAEAICGKILGLPNHPLLTGEQLKYIISTFKELR